MKICVHKTTFFETFALNAKRTYAKYIVITHEAIFMGSTPSEEAC